MMLYGTSQTIWAVQKANQPYIRDGSSRACHLSKSQPTTTLLCIFVSFLQSHLGVKLWNDGIHDRRRDRQNQKGAEKPVLQVDCTVSEHVECESVEYAYDDRDKESPIYVLRPSQSGPVIVFKCYLPKGLSSTA